MKVCYVLELRCLIDRLCVRARVLCNRHKSGQGYLGLRFWLEVLNLTWGDYLIFETSSHKGIDLALDLVPKGWKRKAHYFLLRVQSSASWFVVLLMLNIGWMVVRKEENIDDCGTGDQLYCVAGVMIGCMFLASFFEFLPCFSLVSLSLMTRQLLQAMSPFSL